MTANVHGDDAVGRRVDVVGLCHGMHHVQRHLAAFIDAPFERDLDAVRRHQPPDLHLRLPLDGRGRLAAGAASGATASWPSRPTRPTSATSSTRADGLEQPVLVGDLPSLRRLPRRRGPARHRVLPGALAERRVLRQDARRRRVLGARDPRVGREPLPGRCVARPTATEPLDESIFDRSSGEQEQLIAIIRSVHVRLAARCSRCNVVNNGAVPGLPDDRRVEIPGVATARGIRPIAVPDLGAPLTAILAAAAHVGRTSRSRRR